jgi:hypothetical protein
MCIENVWDNRDKVSKQLFQAPQYAGERPRYRVATQERK